MSKSLRILIVFLVISIGGTAIYVLFAKGIIQIPEFVTIGYDTEEKETITTVEDLKDGYYYVWHNANSDDIQQDLSGTTKPDTFKICPTGTINWTDNQWVSHTVWFNSLEDNDIPTFYPGDELLYISSTAIPFDGIKWERFADYGFTLGVANMIGDKSGHYHISLDVDNGYAGFIYSGSDAAELEKYTTVTELFLDNVGGKNVRDDNVSAGGTVLGLRQNQYYNCQWYTGSYYQDYRMQANVHAYCHLEEFTTYDYDFLHSNCISITIPDYLKTGYYYIEGIGMFRYLEEKDVSLWPGYWAMDVIIDWNEPIIIYNEDGFIEYDPTNPDFIRNNTDPGVPDSEIDPIPEIIDDRISDDEPLEEIIVIESD